MLWGVWYNSDVVRLRNKGGKSALAGFKFVRVISVWWWALILSLQSGEGIGEGTPKLVG